MINYKQITMYRFTRLLELDFILIIRNKILTVAAIVTFLYTIIIQVLPDETFTEILTILIFSDPVMLGFIFTGALVLFEKSSNTLKALTITPVRPGEYLWSKGITLTAIALTASFIMAIAGVGTSFDPFYLLAAVAYSSLLFIFGGFTGVSRIKTFNQYFIVIPLFMIPACLPFLNWLGITETLVWYAIPTQASLILFDVAFKGADAASSGEIIYALIYLPASVYISFLFAKNSWYKTLNS
jgi:fluoroquinolone transport system permease protein